MRVDYTVQDQQGGGIDDVGARVDTGSDLSDLAVHNQHVGILLAPGGHHPPAADQHAVSRTRNQAPISYRLPGSRSRPLTTCQRAATALRPLRRSNGASSVPSLSTLTRP